MTGQQQTDSSISENNQQKTFKIHVRNDVDQNIKFRETAPVIGPVVEVPKDVTAKVDYVDKDKAGKLTFEAVGEKDGEEIKFLLNGEPTFIVDEQNLSDNGEFVVVHKKDQEWKQTLADMKKKATSMSGGSISSTTITGGESGGNQSVTMSGGSLTHGPGMTTATTQTNTIDTTGMGGNHGVTSTASGSQSIGGNGGNMTMTSTSGNMQTNISSASQTTQGGSQSGNMSLNGSSIATVGGLGTDNIFMISVANLASEDAILRQDNGTTISVPSKATESTGVSGNESVVFTAETKSGKPLKIDGESKKTLKELDMPATLVIHEEGNHFLPSVNM